METKTQTELARRFEQILYHFGLNESKLAIYAEVSPSAINNIVNGITDNPKLSLLKNISSKLKISTEWLINGEGEMMKETESTSQVGTLKKSRNEIVEINLQDYLSISKENSFLKNVLLKNGIRIEMPNFSFVGGSATVFVGLFLCLY